MSNVDEQAEAIAEEVAAETVLSGRPGGGEWTAHSIFVLGFLTLISTLNYFDRSVISLVLPLIKKEFGVSDTTLGVVTSVIMFYAVIGVPIAWLAERWSRRNVIAIGLFFWSLMTAVTGFAGSIWQLGIARFFMGVGEGCGLAPSQSLLSDLFSRARRPMVMAVLATASSVAAIVYSPAAGWIAHHWGWRWTFYLAGIPGIILAALFLLTVKEPPRRRISGEAAPAPARLLESLRFVLGSRTFILCLLGTTIAGVYLYGVGAWGTMLLVRVRHMNVEQIGIQIQPVRGAVAAVGILLGGALSSWLERYDARWRCWIAGLSLLALAPCEFLYVFGGPVSVWYPAMLGSSLFSIMHQGPIYAAYVGVAKPRMRAVSVSLALLGATVMGQLGGPILIGRLNDVMHAHYGDLAIRYSMLVVMGCAALGGVCFLLASRTLVADTRRAAE